MLRVNEIFATIQGEASFAGTPATFIRLQGCPVGCPWCDTKHTWPAGQERDQVTVEELLAKVDPTPTWAELEELQILEVVRSLGMGHVVITGGEPCQQEIEALTRLLDAEFTVQVETSGTVPVRVGRGTWVTVSPKFDMPGGWEVLDQALLRADEIKLPVESRQDVAALEARLDLMSEEPRAQVWLQPVSLGEEATQLCVGECMARGWRLSIQTHKLCGIR